MSVWYQLHAVFHSPAVSRRRGGIAQRVGVLLGRSVRASHAQQLVVRMFEEGVGMACTGLRVGMY